jgi:hypothetical protein
MKNEFESVLENLIKSGITDEDEQVEIIVRDYPHLLPKPSESELISAAVQSAILEANRESFQNSGRPAFACKRIDGEMKYKSFSSLTESEIAELKNEGIIPA